MLKLKKKNAAPVLILFGIVLGILIKLFVIDFLQVSGTSMEQTIDDKSVIAVNRLAFGIAIPFRDTLIVQWKEPERDDIVIYLYNNKIVVKRCVGIAGDRLDFIIDSGYSLLVGGKRINLSQEQYGQLKSSTSVPDGYILAVGDNYEHSIDSRTYGFVPVKNILGKVLWK